MAAQGLLLSTPMLTDTAAEAVDARTVKFPLRAELKKKKEEEEEEKREVVGREQRRQQAFWDDFVEKERQRTSRRKRKKRRKKRLPRTPLPRHGCRRPCDHQRQVPAVRSSDSVHLLTLGTPVATLRQVPTVHSFMPPCAVLGQSS